MPATIEPSVRAAAADLPASLAEVRTMTAAILAEQRADLIVDEVELPTALDVGQVFVRVEHAGICGAQLGEIDGVKGRDPYLPHLLGHEGGAMVIETGPGVRHVKPGDRVVMHWRKGVGIDAAPPRYRWRGKALNAGAVTTFNPFAVVSENRLTVLPRDFDLRLATLFGCAVTTGLGVVTNNAKLKLGESIVVLGAGGVGLSIVQGAAMTGAYPIIAVDLFNAKLALARQLGATHVINARGMSADDLDAAVRTCLSDPPPLREGSGEGDAACEPTLSLSPPTTAQRSSPPPSLPLKGEGSEKTAGADVVIENTGRVELIELAYHLTNDRGRTVLVGVPAHDAKAKLHTLPLHFDKTLTGSHGGEAQPHLDIPRYVRLVQAGRLKLEPLITDTCALEGINDAIARMRNGDIVGRCVIDMTAV